MPYSDLNDFIDFLEQNNELIRVNEAVSTVLEMTEIQSRVIAEKGPAILFEKPLDSHGNISPIPVLVNSEKNRGLLISLSSCLNK